MVKSLGFALALALAWAPSTGPASAQPAANGDESARMQARRLFEEGIALAKSERWAEALSSFQQSRELVPRPSTSYNIANACYRLDRPVEGLLELDAYDAMPEVVGDVAARERGARLRELLQAAAAEARLTITPIDAEVYIDGRRAESNEGEWLIRLNPGRHSLRVAREGYQQIIREIWVERGSRQAYTIALRPLTPSPPATVAVAPSSVTDEPIPVAQDDRKPFVKRPGFWAVIGAVAAVGIGVGVGIAMTRRDDGPQCGTTGTCATTQGLTVTSF